MHDGDPQSQPYRGFRGGEGAVGAGIAPHQVPQRIRHGLNEGQWHAHGQRDAKGVAQAGCVLNSRIPRFTRHIYVQRAPCCEQLGQVHGHLRQVHGFLGEAAGVVRVHRFTYFQQGNQPDSNLGLGEWTQETQQVRHTLQAAGAAVHVFPAAGQPLQLGFGGGNDFRVEEFAQLGAAQQLVKEGRIQGQGCGAALCQRGVALVHEAGHVAKEQRAGEGRGLVRGGFDNAQFAAFNARGNGLQGWEVIDVLQAFAHRFEHDGELRVLPGHIQQLGGALALLPQG